MRVGAIALLTLALAACVFWVGVSAQSPDQQHSISLVYTSTPHYEAGAWLHGGERFPAGATVMVWRDGKSRPLVTGFVATADPSVSFDGTRVLFSGKRDAKSPWQIWEVAVSGGAPRQVTAGSADCIRPFYLPGERVVYARKANNRFVLETAALAGGAPLQLTYAPGNALATDVLRDGRILFEAAYPLGSGIVIRDLHGLFRWQRRRVLPLRSWRESASGQAGRVRRYCLREGAGAGTIYFRSGTSVGLECAGWRICRRRGASSRRANTWFRGVPMPRHSIRCSSGIHRPAHSLRSSQTRTPALCNRL